MGAPYLGTRRLKVQKRDICETSRPQNLPERQNPPEGGPCAQARAVATLARVSRVDRYFSLLVLTITVRKSSVNAKGQSCTRPAF